MIRIVLQFLKWVLLLGWSLGRKKIIDWRKKLLELTDLATRAVKKIFKPGPVKPRKRFRLFDIFRRRRK